MSWPKSELREPHFKKMASATTELATVTPMIIDPRVETQRHQSADSDSVIKDQPACTGGWVMGASNPMIEVE